MADQEVSNDNPVVEKGARVALKPSQLPAKHTVEFTTVEELTLSPIRSEFGIGTKSRAAASERTAVTPSANAVSYMFRDSDFTTSNRPLVIDNKIIAASCNTSVEKRIAGGGFAYTEYLCDSPRTAEINLPATVGGTATLRRTAYKPVEEIRSNIEGFYGGLREIAPKIDGNNVGVTAVLTEIPLTILSPKGDSVDQYLSRVYDFNAPLAAPLYSKPKLSTSMQSLEINETIGKTPEGDDIANISSDSNMGGKSSSFIAIVPKNRTPGVDFEIKSLQGLQPDGFYFKGVATASDGTIVAEKIKLGERTSVESSYVVISRARNGEYSVTAELKLPGNTEISQIVPVPENFKMDVPSVSINNVERMANGSLAFGGSVSFRISDTRSNINEVNVTSLAFVTKQDSNGEFKTELLQPFKMDDTVKGKKVELTFYPSSAFVTPEGAAYGTARVGDPTKIVNYRDNQYVQLETFIKAPTTDKVAPMAHALKVAPNFDVTRYEYSSSGNGPLFSLEAFTFDRNKPNSPFRIFGSGTVKFDEYSYGERVQLVQVPRTELYRAAEQAAN